MIRSTLLLSLLASAIGCSTPDLSTDEGVLRALNSSRSRGDRLSEDDVCVKRANKMQGVVLVGYFVHDRGCTPGEIFVDGKIYSREEASRLALEKLGWKQASEAKRRALAALWTRRGLMPFEGSLLKKEPENFGRPDFAAIKGRSVGSDFQVSLWMQEPPGMHCGQGYTQLRFVFRSDGSLVAREEVKSFFLPCE